MFVNKNKKANLICHFFVFKYVNSAFHIFLSMQFEFHIYQQAPPIRKQVEQILSFFYLCEKCNMQIAYLIKYTKLGFQTLIFVNFVVQWQWLITQFFISLTKRNFDI